MKKVTLGLWLCICMSLAACAGDDGDEYTGRNINIEEGEDEDRDENNNNDVCDEVFLECPDGTEPNYEYDGNGCIIDAYCDDDVPRGCEEACLDEYERHVRECEILGEYAPERAEECFRDAEEEIGRCLGEECEPEPEPTCEEECDEEYRRHALECEVLAEYAPERAEECFRDAANSLGVCEEECGGNNGDFYCNGDYCDSGSQVCVEDLSGQFFPEEQQICTDFPLECDGPITCECIYQALEDQPDMQGVELECYEDDGGTYVTIFGGGGDNCEDECARRFEEHLQECEADDGEWNEECYEEAQREYERCLDGECEPNPPGCEEECERNLEERLQECEGADDDWVEECYQEAYNDFENCIQDRCEPEPPNCEEECERELEAYLEECADRNGNVDDECYEDAYRQYENCIQDRCEPEPPRCEENCNNNFHERLRECEWLLEEGQDPDRYEECIRHAEEDHNQCIEDCNGNGGDQFECGQNLCDLNSEVCVIDEAGILIGTSEPTCQPLPADCDGDRPSCECVYEFLEQIGLGDQVQLECYEEYGTYVNIYGENPNPTCQDQCTLNYNSHVEECRWLLEEGDDPEAYEECVREAQENYGQCEQNCDPEPPNCQQTCEDNYNSYVEQCESLLDGRNDGEGFEECIRNAEESFDQCLNNCNDGFECITVDGDVTYCEPGQQVCIQDAAGLLNQDMGPAYGCADFQNLGQCQDFDDICECIYQSLQDVDIALECSTDADGNATVYTYN